ncbi:MAG TPA: imidazoleglycerol-phosphate dehydratase, partial [Gemmataceae bacterium]|nr:imidazoleglycerol-phosphate dehydratase [Gemmataceae bacterium]
HADIPLEILGTFNAPLAEEFWRAVSSAGACNLHVVCHHGKNTHHIVEAIFKAAARALRQAVESDPRMPGIPSTKGVL